MASGTTAEASDQAGIAPPEYSTAPPSTQHLSLIELRTQIIANGSVLCKRASRPHGENWRLVEPTLVVAKTPSPAQRQKRLHELQAEEESEAAATATATATATAIASSSSSSSDPNPNLKAEVKSLLPSILKLGSKDDKKKVEEPKATKATKDKTLSRAAIERATYEATTADLQPEAHYAVLMHIYPPSHGSSTFDREPEVVMRGEPRDSIMQALEQLLEKTERMMHDTVVGSDVSTVRELLDQKAKIKA